MSFRRSLLPVLLLTLLAACAAQGQATDCADGAFPMARLELYFGTQRPGGAPVTATEWAAFLDEEVTPRSSEEHTSELQSLMRISYAVFCLTKITTNNHTPRTTNT